MSPNTMWRFRNTWQPNEIILVHHLFSLQNHSWVNVFQTNYNPEQWKLGSRTSSSCPRGFHGDLAGCLFQMSGNLCCMIQNQSLQGKMQGQDGPTATIMMNIGAGKNRGKVSVCQTGIKLNYELFFFHFRTAKPSSQAMAPPTLSQVLLEASAIQMVNGCCGHFCWPY